jgi:hypothetical protein
LKYPSRYKVVSALKRIIISSISELNLDIPFTFLSQIFLQFQSTLTLGFYFFLCFFFNIVFRLYLDNIINFEIKKNIEINKYSININKGMKEMNRDINLKLLEFHKSNEDTREVFLFLLYFYFIKL